MEKVVLKSRNINIKRSAEKWRREWKIVIIAVL